MKDFFSKCDQIYMKLRIWSHLLKKSLMENFIFCAVFIACNVFRNTGNLQLIISYSFETSLFSRSYLTLKNLDLSLFGKAEKELNKNRLERVVTELLNFKAIE